MLPVIYRFHLEQLEVKRNISGLGTLLAGGAGIRTITDTSGLSLANGTNGGIGSNFFTGGTHSLTINHFL